MSKPACRACGSPDTVGYWEIRENQDDGSAQHAILKRHYPNARKCVDCGAVDYDTTRPRGFILPKGTT